MKFNEKVYKAVNQIPKGKVTSYGFIAIFIGKPRAARQVGWALASLPYNIPWWRVINAKGYISIKNRCASKDEQKELLENDGVEVFDDYTIDLNKYIWRPKT